MQILPPLLGDILNGLGCHQGTLGNLCCRAAFFAGFVGWTSSGITPPPAQRRGSMDR
jgi:hypothetical protein